MIVLKLETFTRIVYWATDNVKKNSEFQIIAELFYKTNNCVINRLKIWNNLGVILGEDATQKKKSGAKFAAIGIGTICNDVEYPIYKYKHKYIYKDNK